MSMSKFATQADYFASIQSVKATSDKPVVKYKRMAGSGLPEVGIQFDVVPVDHPSESVNGHWSITSVIVSVGDDGSFETRNTRYELA